jgi:hypothetical protein
MKNLTKTLIAVSAGALISVGANAFDVTATVTNTITLTQTTPMTLGNVYLKKGVGAGAQAYVDLDPDTGALTSTVGAEATTPGKFVGLGGAQAGVLSVTGAQAFGDVTVNHGALTNLVHSSGNPGLPVIVFTSLDTTPADAALLTLDGSGNGDILVGGRFTSAAPAAGGAYQDGTYTGTYAITVSY